MYSEVYVGRGSRLPVLKEPISDTRELPQFDSSVTNTTEMCVIILESIIHIYIPIGDRHSARLHAVS